MGVIKNKKNDVKIRQTYYFIMIISNKKKKTAFKIQTICFIRPST